MRVLSEYSTYHRGFWQVATVVVAAHSSPGLGIYILEARTRLWQIIIIVTCEKPIAS